MKPVSSTTAPDFKECNCRNGVCQLHGAACKCNTRNVIYQISCKFCNDAYIGNTSTPLKTRIRNHITDFKNCIRCPATPTDHPPPGDPPDPQDAPPPLEEASIASQEDSPTDTLPSLQESTTPRSQDPGGGGDDRLRQRVTDNNGLRRSSTTFATHMAKCWRKAYLDTLLPGQD